MTNQPTVHCTYTPSFQKMLEQTQSSLLISTYQSHRVIIARVVDGTIQLHFHNYPRPMGMVSSNGVLSIGVRNRVENYLLRTPDLAAMLNHDVDLTGLYTKTSETTTGGVDIHEMYYNRNGQLFFVNTQFSCVATTDSMYSWKPHWRPSWITAYQPSDRCHLNGITGDGGDPKYATSVATTDTPMGWRDHKLDGGVIVDLHTNQLVTDHLSMPHSPRLHRGRLYVLDSGNGRLLEVCVKTGAKRIVCELPGFGRGMALYEHIALVGISKIRETTSFGGMPIATRDIPRQCGVWMVDLNSGEILGSLTFQNGVDEIFSVCHVPSARPEILDPRQHKKYDAIMSVGHILPEVVLREFQPPAASGQGDVLWRQVVEMRGEPDHDQDQVQELVTQILALNPTHPGALLTRAELAWREGYPMITVEDANLVLAQDRQNVHAYVLRAHALISLERYAEARDTIITAQSYHPQPRALVPLLESVQKELVVANAK